VELIDEERRRVACRSDPALLILPELLLPVSGASVSFQVDNGERNFERWRRWFSWLCLVVFSATFAGLLGLSATRYWTPDNPWIALLDRGWRLSGGVGIALAAIPYLLQGARWLRRLFAGA
jgi:hypothetical protein